MMKRLMSLCLVFTMLAVFGPAPAGATPPERIEASGLLINVDPPTFQLTDGDIAGTITYTEQRGAATFGTCDPCTVGDRTGTLFGVFVEPVAGATEFASDGTWTIQGGTGDLAGVHGHGTWTFDLPDITLEGKIHFEKGGK